MSDRVPDGVGPPPRATPPVHRSSEAPEATVETSGTRGLSRRAKQALGAAGGLIALLVGVTNLVDWIEGKLSDPPPAAIDPRIEGAELQLRGERLIDYLRDTNQDTSGLTKREREEKGLRFVVRVRLQGEQGTPIDLRWQMYDDVAGERLRDPIYGQTAATFTPSNQDHARRVPLWLPYPPKKGRFATRFSLIDPERKPLDEAVVRFRVQKVPTLE